MKHKAQVSITILCQIMVTSTSRKGGKKKKKRRQRRRQQQQQLLLLLKKKVHQMYVTHINPHNENLMSKSHLQISHLNLVWAISSYYYYKLLM